MNFQTIIVGIIILLACFYVGKIVFGKVKSFSPKTASCGTDCSCNVKDKS